MVDFLLLLLSSCVPIVGGAEYGVAKQVDLVGVKVLSDEGGGSNSGILAGIDWVIGEAQNDDRPGVVNMSLGGILSPSLNLAVSQLILQGGVFTAVAAGNSNVNACASSPSSGELPMTVGATDMNDNRASFSNRGDCVDIFAPGVDITSTWWKSDSDVATISGTSMASPHVAGAAALYLQVNPDAFPFEIKRMIFEDGLEDKVSDPGPNSPNLLLNTESLFTTLPGNVTDDCSHAVALLGKPAAKVGVYSTVLAIVLALL